MCSSRHRRVVWCVVGGGGALRVVRVLACAALLCDACRPFPHGHDSWSRNAEVPGRVLPVSVSGTVARGNFDMCCKDALCGSKVQRFLTGPYDVPPSGRRRERVCCVCVVGVVLAVERGMHSWGTVYLSAGCGHVYLSAGCGQVLMYHWCPAPGAYLVGSTLDALCSSLRVCLAKGGYLSLPVSDTYTSLLWQWSGTLPC